MIKFMKMISLGSNKIVSIQLNLLIRCLACKEHTRAYIHHLLKCNEMTAHVLLTIHNLHSNEKLFATLH
jgi:tRNA-guanine family transglycosylase